MTHLDRPRGTSRGELRKFAFLVGGVLVALAANALWRHRSVVTVRMLGAIGGFLVVMGAVAPGVLRPVYAAWMRLALVLSKVTTPIFMAIVYYFVLTPTGWLMRLFGWQGLAAGSRTSVWVPRAEGERASALERQF